MRFLKIFLLVVIILSVSTPSIAERAVASDCTKAWATNCNNIEGCLDQNGTCGICPAGYYCEAKLLIDKQAILCPATYYCLGGNKTGTEDKCPSSYPNSDAGAKSAAQCYSISYSKGYEYDLDTKKAISCNKNASSSNEYGYCPYDVKFYNDGTTYGNRWGWTPCTTDATRTVKSTIGATMPTNCYVICPNKTIDHGRQTAPAVYATIKTNNNGNIYDASNYQYATCTYTTTCDTGYHVSGSACIANTYTVKFNKGTKPENASGEIQRTGYADIYSQLLTYDTAATLEPVRFSLTGWTFAHWCTNDTGNCGTKYTDGQTVKNLTTANNGLIDLYPRWTPNLYTITLYQNNATTDGTTKLYTKYDTGVYTDSARTKQMTISANPITKPQQKYTVTLNPDGGSVSPTELTATIHTMNQNN